MDLILPLAVLLFAVFHTIWMSRAASSSTKSIFDMLKDERQRWIDARAEDHAREILLRQRIADLERMILESELAAQYVKRAGRGKTTADFVPPQYQRPQVPPEYVANGNPPEHPRILADEPEIG